MILKILMTILKIMKNLLRKLFFEVNKSCKLRGLILSGSLLVVGYFCFVNRSHADDELLKFVKNNIFHSEFAGSKACGKFPCFGSTLCNSTKLKLISIYSNDIRGVDGWLKLSGITKSKYRVKWNVTFTFPLLDRCDSTSCSIQLKKELFSIGNYQSWVCRKLGFNDDCNIEHVIHDWPPMRKILLDTGRLNPNIIKELSSPLQCASSRLADRLLRYVLGSRGKGSTNLKDYTYSEKAQLIFLSKMNPEFLIQRMFPFQDFQFNEAVGVCGLMTLHKGGVEPTLFDLYHAPWYVRVDVAVQLLDLAYFYTENDSKFMFLMHKLTPYDISLSEYRSVQVRNANNLVVVDTIDSTQEFKSKSYEVLYSKKDYRVPENEICRYNKTDINFYTVCRYFLMGPWKDLNGNYLAGGLLHDPEGLSIFQSKLSFLLDVCARGNAAIPQTLPKLTFFPRKTAAGHLRLLLRTARVCSPEFIYRYPECELYEKDYDLNNLRFYKLSNDDIKWL